MPQVSDRLIVEIGGATQIEFRMTIASARESVTVSGGPKAVETEPRGFSLVVDERAILNFPLNGRRVIDICLLTSQATTDPRGQNSTSNGDLSFGGVRGFHTSYLVDGGDNNNDTWDALVRLEAKDPVWRTNVDQARGVHFGR